MRDAETNKPSEQSHPPLTSVLCEDCTNLRLITGNHNNHRTDAALGRFRDIQQRTCPFCQLVASVHSKATISWEAPKPIPGSLVIRAYWLNAIKGSQLQPMPSLGFKICFVDTETEDHRTARRIEGQWIDLVLPRGWLMACKEEHGNDCEPPLFKRANAVGSGAELRTLRMVDVKEMCVVDAPDECRYLALSYVCGKAREGIFTPKRGNKTALMTRGGLFPARWSIPDTV
jgi:hypothetical protein